MVATKPTVLVTRNDYPEVALIRLRNECDVEEYPYLGPMPRDVILERIKGKNGLLCLPSDKIDKELLEAAGKSLKVVATISSGFDHFDLDEMKARGVKAGHSRGVLTEAVAEFSVGLLIATARRFLEAHRDLASGDWAKYPHNLKWMIGSGLQGSTVGIFGFGGIGQDVVKKLQGFSVGKFIYNSRSQRKEAKELSASYVSFDELVRDSDFIVITCSLNDQTKQIFNKDAFDKMKKNAILINVSRGGVVDQDALIEALKTGQIRAAGLDVMVPEPLPVGHPLINTPNLTLMPHIASAEKNARNEMILLGVNNIIAALKGEKMPAGL